MALFANHVCRLAMCSIKMMLLAAVAAQCALAEDAFLADAQLIFHKSVPSYAAGYSRLSTNDSSVVFWVETVQEPVVRQEWRISGPEYRWTVSPDKAGRNLPSSMDSRSELMWFDIASDFGKSYTVEVDVEWKAFNEVGDSQTSRRHFSFDIDAIIYDFDMACVGGIVSENDDPLVDNRAANVIIEARGCSRIRLLDLEMDSSPVRANPLNKAGTQMDFQRTGPLSFFVPKTYWYGEPEPFCCHSFSNPYRVRLKADIWRVCEKEFSVGFLEEVNDMIWTAWAPDFEIGEPEPVGDGRWRVLVNIGEFKKTTRIVVNSTNQYAPEARREELFHSDQFMGYVGVADGGAPDLFDVRQVYESLGIFSMQNRFLYSLSGESMVAFTNRIYSLIVNRIKAERTWSETLWDNDLGVQESCAKRHAGYNAAFRYHCTYTDDCGPEGNQVPRPMRALQGAW